MTKSAGPGRRPIPADLYLVRWNPVVESLKAGDSVRAITKQHGTSAETVRHVRRFREDGGWTPAPKPVTSKIVRPNPEPKPPTPRMTGADLLRKYPAIALWLREGKTMKQASTLAGVRVNTVRVVRDALVAQGEIA